MSTIPANISRAPNLLFSQLSLANINRTNVDLFRVQTKLATGLDINRPSDNPVRASTISILDDRLERAQQRLRNLDNAKTSLDLLDASLGEASNFVLEAKTIASTQVSTGTTSLERSQQAVVINSLITGLSHLSNREGPSGFLFGGSHASTKPIDSFMGGYRYTGEGAGLQTDLGLGVAVPVTMEADHALGSTSARVKGTVDLQPALTPNTRLSDLRGARGLGVSAGPIQFSFDGGPLTRIDLSGATTVQDVVDRISSSLKLYETDNSVTILGAGGVSISGESISIDVASGVPDPDLEFLDIGTSVIGLDMGLVAEPSSVFNATNALGAGLDPKLTWLTPITALQGLSDPLGQIRVNNMSQSRIVNLTNATTLGDIRNEIEGTGLGTRVRIGKDDSLDVVNEVAAGKAQAMSIAEITGNNRSATALGIRTMALDTRVGDFNDGRGVRIVTGSVDPISGLADPTKDTDFTITLGDAGGTTFNVDLRPEDVITVGGVIDRINAQAAAQGVSVPGDFQAALADGDNGIMLTQNTSNANALSVARQNNSLAAQDLGLMTGSYDVSSATFAGEDRATVRVDNVFTHLLDLRDALEGNDTLGITLAGSKLEETVNLVALNRGMIGGHGQRVEQASLRQEDSVLFDETTRSGLRDLDFAQAASSFSLLQTQLQAALQTSAAVNTRTLLDFLG